jgi:hypothetical protein
MNSRVSVDVGRGLVSSHQRLTWCSHQDGIGGAGLGLIAQPGLIGEPAREEDAEDAAEVIVDETELCD